MQHEPKALVTKQKQQSLEGIKTGDEETKWNEVFIFCGFTLNTFCAIIISSLSPEGVLFQNDDYGN